MSSSFPMYDMAEADTDPTNLLDDIYSSLIIPLLNELQQLRSPTRDQMPAHGKGKRPYKVWDSGRQVRKGLVVASFNELIEKGREKLELGEVRIKVVLEADGTQVEDPEYFCTLPENTVFLLLRQGEHWYPAGVEVLRQAITAIPKIVCETIYSLGLHDEAPVWKIMDQYGKITVVLSWDPCHRGDHRHGTSSPRKPSATATRMIVSGVGESAIQRHEYLVAQPSVGSTPSPAPTISLSGTKSPVPASGAAGISAQAPVGTVTTILRDGKKETLINDIGPAAATLPPAPHHQVHKAVATSPIQEGTHERRPAHHHTHPPSQSPGGKAAQPGAQAAAVQHPKGSSHVRFQTQTQTEYRTPNLEKPRERPDQDSSESETENTTNDEEAHTTEKFLLLTDQLSVDTKKHLSIKDIGVILDRLSSKIVDVEKLDREAEEEDCFNWTIKATIRGDTLRELGVVYNGHYYSISEHPGYGQKKEEEEEEEVAEAKDAEKEPV
ncbi:uncharacterized protein LOC121871795 isoform X6 [Homarus americanus]|uniref:uncharacterized protein LOC121871795 isoform X6 n=1 Tax=Homarus americanus TaxID=6706 RepID=UPI001C43F726|nr:uncharacterized protein LOC121871795 isoform X6 [Homarus americanus]